MITVLELLQTTTKYLEKHGVENPRLNVEHLLAHTLGLKRIELYLQFDRPLSEKELEPLRETVRKRTKGIPLQHLLGTVEFHGRVFKSDGRALIPRPETEQFVEQILDYWKPRGAAPNSIVDVGTGSGVIAITLALTWPEASVHAVDVSPDALSLAGENAQALGAERILFEQSDLFASVPPGSFDLIAANLPYIEAKDMEALSKEVRHDPALALAGGADGLDVIRRLVTSVPERIVPGGVVALEIGHGQGYALSEFLRENRFGSISVRRDYQGLERFVFAIYG